MNINKFTQKSIEAVNQCEKIAYDYGNQEIDQEHFLYSLMTIDDSLIANLIEKMQINKEAFISNIETLLSQKTKVSGNVQLYVSNDLNKVLINAEDEAKRMGDAYVSVEHLMLAMIASPNKQIKQLFKTYGITRDAFLSVLATVRGNQSVTSDNPEATYDTLAKYGQDLVEKAKSGKLDPVIGRDNEIRNVIRILSRKTKNNPVLIGEPGVGKSAIVEGLALRIVQKKVSRILFDKRVVMLDMASVVAGTKYRGQFEERIRSIINELQKNPNVILFIDEIHTIVGAGAAAGSMDAANMLKPALARGEIQCIGATTLDEYRKNIEKDGALERRFQKVIVEPTTPEETLQILRNIKEKYEDHHNVSYTDEALEACVKLAERYITDRNFPDKAIDALDEAGSRVHLTNINVPKEIEEQEKLIEDARVLKAEAVKSQNFELAASYRDREKELSARLDEMKEEWEARLKDDRQLVGEEEIANVISMMSGIPVQRMAQAEGLKLAGMKEDLQAKVVAQDAAIEKLTKAILRSRVGLKDPNRPIGTFMFLGPTGVGKTHLAKQLAKYMFGSSDALIRIDMSEYMEKYTVSRMIGAAPGYVGYEEGGQLTEKVRRKPYSIVLLDEIEKAHPDVFNILLQVLDDGHITDAQGRKVDFKQTCIIMTSNAGAQNIVAPKRLGFLSTEDERKDYEYMKGQVMEEVKRMFKPEFLNRIDEIIVFHQLTKADMKKILQILLKDLERRCKEQMDIELKVRDTVKEYLVENSFDSKYGARPLKRAIQSKIEDPLAEAILNGEVKKGDTVAAGMNKKEITFKVLEKK